MSSQSRQTINIAVWSNGVARTYKVESTTNRMNPMPGEILQEKEVEGLIHEAKVSNSSLYVNLRDARKK